MRRIDTIFTSISLCLASCAAHDALQPQATSKIHRTEVVIVSTIHRAHYKNPKYSPYTLKQIILSLRPAAILNELPLSQVDPNGRPLFRDRRQHAEGWAADAVATQLHIRQIPFDRPDREENFRRTGYFERERRWRAAINKWCEQVEKQDPNSVDLETARLWLRDADQALAHLTLNAAPEIINSETNDSLVTIKHSIWYDIFPHILAKYRGYEILIDDCRYFRDQWYERNRSMADNIIKACKDYPGKLVVVITGCYHRYILRDLLSKEESIDLKEYWEIIDAEPVKRQNNAPNAEKSQEQAAQDPLEGLSK